MIKELEQILQDYGIKTENDLIDLNNTSLHNPYILANIDKAIDLLKKSIALDKQIYIVHDDNLGSIFSASLLYYYLSRISQLIDVVSFDKYVEKKDIIDIDLVLFFGKKNLEEEKLIHFEYTNKPSQDSIHSLNLFIHKSLPMIVFDFIRIFNLKALPKGKRIVLKEETVITAISLFSQKSLFNKEQKTIIRLAMPILFQTNIVGLNLYLDECRFSQAPSFHEICYYFNLLVYKLQINKQNSLLINFFTAKNLMVFDLILKNKIDYRFEQAILNKPISGKLYDVFEMDFKIFATFLYKINPIPIDSYFYITLHGIKKFRVIDETKMDINDNLTIIAPKEQLLKLKDNLSARIDGFIVSNGVKCQFYMKNIKI